MPSQKPKTPPKYERKGNCQIRFVLPLIPGGGERTIEMPSVTQMIKRRKEIEDYHRNRFEAGDLNAASEILKIDPLFIRLPWVTEHFMRLQYSGDKNSLLKFLGADGRSQKRQSNGFRDKGIVVAVNTLVEKEGISQEKAFLRLEKFFPISFDRIKAIFYANQHKIQPEILLFDNLPEPKS